MGGLVSIVATMQLQKEENFSGAVYCAPAIRVCGQGLIPKNCAYNPIFRALGKIVSLLSAGTFPVCIIYIIFLISIQTSHPVLGF